MKRQFSRYLTIVLSLCMILSMCPLTSFASDDTALLSQEPVYYVQHGASGNGLSLSSPGSFATVVADINQKYDADDTVIVKIVKAANEADTYTDISQIGLASIADIPAHTAMLVLTSADENNYSWLTHKNNYSMTGSDNNNGNVELKGPITMTKLNLLDPRNNWHADFYAMGHSVKFCSDIVWYSPKVSNGTLNLKGEKTQANVHGGARSTKTFTTAGVVELCDGIQLGNANGFALSGYNTSGTMTFNEDITFKIGTGTLQLIKVDNMNGAYAHFKKNANMVFNGTTVNKLQITSASSKGTSVDGAIQIISNGANIKAYEPNANLVEKTYYITSPEGIKLDVTEKAGKYTVSGDGIVYALSDDGKTAWYSKDGYFTVGKAGIYAPAVANSIDAVKNDIAFMSGTPVDKWIDNGDGTLTATDDASGDEGEGTEDAVYYVQHGASGNGLTIENPGSFNSVVTAINKKYGKGDTVTIKVVKAPGEADSYTDLSSIALACWADIPAHEAMLVITSADPDDWSWVTNKNQYAASGYIATNVELAGPITFKDIKIVDPRMDYYGDIYANSHDFVICEGIQWYRPKYSNNTLILNGMPSYGSVNGGSRSVKTFNTECVIELGDGVNYGNENGNSLSGYYTSGTMTFNESITYKLGKGTSQKLIIDNLKGGNTYFKKNANIVLNGTTVNSLVSTRAESKGTVVDGYIQIIKNGATVKSQTIASYLVEKLYDITSPEGTKLDVTGTAGTYTVESDKIVYIQSADKKTAWYSKDGLLTVDEVGTYTALSADSIEEIKSALEIPEFSSVYVFNGWKDDGNGKLIATVTENEALKYYVKDGANGSGNSANDPCSMKQAMQALGENDGFIFVIGTYTMSGTDYAAHTGHISIEGYDSSAILASKDGDGISFGGPVTFKGITYKRGTNAYIVTRGSDVVFDKGFAITSTDEWMVFGGAMGNTSVNDINVTVNSGDFKGKFNVGAIMPSSGGFAVKNDANINVNGGSISNILLGSTNWGSCGAVTFEKSVVIINDGGSISKISAVASGNGSPTKIDGSLVVVNNYGVAAPVYDSTLDAISIDSKYYVSSALGGKITPVTDANGNFNGKFYITIDEDEKNRALIENGDSLTTLEESGEITLNPGTTTVSYGDYPPNPGKTVPMTWKEMDKGYITLIFDDVRTDFKTIFEIVSKEYNLPLCAAVPSNNIKNDPQSLHELQDRGGEILSHTKSHMVIKPFQTSWADVETQLGDSYRILTEEGFNVNGIILAGGTGQIAATDTEYRGLIELVTNKYYKYSDKYGLSTQYWKQRNWFSGRTLDQLKQIVDTQAQNKTWEVIYGHDLTEVSAENLRAFCEYLVQLQNEGKIKVVTYKYMHENFGDWETPVDFGDTTYTVEFYGTDRTTLVEKQVIVEGEDAKAPTAYTLAEGYTLVGWDGVLENVDNNRKVYAICNDAQGNPVTPDSGDSVITPPPVVIPTTFYVSESGSDSNEGTSADSPFATFEKVISVADVANDFEIKVIGSYTLPAPIQGFTGTLTISGYNADSEIKTNPNGGYSIKGNVTIKNIKFTNGLYAWFSANGYKFTLGENVTTSGNHQIVAGGNYGTVGTGVHDIKVSSGTWNKLILGAIASGSTHAISGDSKVEISGGTVNNLIIGNDGWASSHKNSSFASNIAIKVNGGTVKNLSLAQNNYAPVISGSIIVLLNNDTSITTVGAGISDNAYFVKSGMGGNVDYVYENGKTVAGKIKVTPDEGKFAIVENNNTKVYLYTEGTATISKGETTVTYGDLDDLDIVIRVNDGNKEHLYGADDVIELTVGGKISFPTDIVKDGYLFGGWYSDASYTTPVANESNVSAGTTLYARWIKLDEKDLYTEGVQIRINAPTGLRFVNNITHETRDTIISLNSANEILSPENEGFNANDGISYGTIVVPFDTLGDNELVKNGTYDYNNKQYAAKTVPAKNTYQILEGFDRYTAVLIDIPANNLTTNYTARAYMTYTDASGMTRTVYGEQYTASLYSVAYYVYNNGANDFEEDQRESVLSFLYESILSVIDGVENPLANTYRALNNDKKLTVGFLGGSITDGSSAKKLVQNGNVSASGGDIALSYVNRTASWLKESFPNAEIEVINAGISDTATNFGVYRLESHLMNTDGHDMPDLVFVEFNSNDWIYDDCVKQTKADLSRQVESLVRNIYENNPYADIVFVSTARSETAASRVVYREIAEEFGILCIDMGIPMQALMTANGAANESTGTYRYTTDNLHPSVEGYGVYFEEIKKALAEYLIDTPVYYETLYNHEDGAPEQINRSLWIDPEIIPASEFEVSGSVTTSEALYSPMYAMNTSATSAYFTPDSITVSGEDAKVSFDFYGTSFGLIFNMNASGFNIDYTIDGKDVKNITVDEDFLSFQKYTHNQIFIFEQELAYGKHTIEMTFNKTSDGKVNVKIGGAAVAGIDNGMDKLIALTIDDGPKVVASNGILDVLERYGAHATFFAVGSSCNENTKAVLNRMLAAGCEIGNHSNGWNAVSGRTTEEVLADFNACQEKIYSLTGVYPAVFRAPGNSVDAAVYAAIPVPIMNGYNIGTDWEASYTYESRLRAFRNAVADGRIILIHDQEANIPVLEVMIPELIEQGYKIVTATELYTLRGYNPPKYAQVMYKEFNK